MDYRGVLLVGMLSAAAVIGAVSACDAPDPGQITFIERPKGSSGELTTGGLPPVEAGTLGEGGTTTEGGTADGGSSGSTSGDPVFGTTTFALGSPGRGAPAKMANAAHNGDASGKDCIVSGCHLNQWGFGGTLYADAAGAARVANAEVRISGPDGKLFQSTYSDVDGNFWIDGLGIPIPAGSRVGVRTADGKKMNMAGSIGPAQAGCSQGGTCHGKLATPPGTEGLIHLP